MPKKVSSVCKEDKRIWFFFCKPNFSKWSYAHVGSSFHNPAKKFSSEGWKFFAHFWQKKTKTPTIFWKNLIFFKGFLSTRRFQFRQSCSKYSDKMLKKFAQKKKLMKNIYIFLKKNLVKMFLGTRRIQFLQQKELCSLSKSDRENFFFKKYSSKCIYRDVVWSFFKPAEKSLPDERSFSCQSLQKNWKLENFSRKFFSSKCSYGHLENTIGNPIEKTMTKNQIFFLLSVRKRKMKFKTFFRKIYLSNCSCKDVESSSGSPASIFLTKGRKFFTQCPEMIKNFIVLSVKPAEKTSTECRKSFAQCARIIKII